MRSRRRRKLGGTLTANSGPGLALSALLASSLLPASSAAREPTEQEQFMVELINRARLDPAAEVAYFGLGSLNEGPPTLGGVPYTIQGGPHQAVAVNPGIVDATSDYAELMEANDTFCHTCLGTDPQDRMFAAGYVSALSDFDPPGGVASYTLDYGYADGGGAGIFLPGPIRVVGPAFTAGRSQCSAPGTAAGDPRPSLPRSGRPCAGPGSRSGSNAAPRTRRSGPARAVTGRAEGS